MKFGDVLDALMEGEPVSRESWKKYLYYDEPENVFVISYSANNQWMSSALDLHAKDLFADDWQICEWDDHTCSITIKVDR